MDAENISSYVKLNSKMADPILYKRKALLLFVYFPPRRCTGSDRPMKQMCVLCIQETQQKGSPIHFWRKVATCEACGEHRRQNRVVSATYVDSSYFGEHCGFASYFRVGPLSSAGT